MTKRIVKLSTTKRDGTALGGLEVIHKRKESAGWGALPPLRFGESGRLKIAVKEGWRRGDKVSSRVQKSKRVPVPFPTAYSHFILVDWLHRRVRARITGSGFCETVQGPCRSDPVKPDFDSFYQESES